MFQIENQYPVSKFEASEKEYVIQPYDKISIRVVSNIGESLLGTGSQAGGSNSANNQRNQIGLEFPVEFDGLVKLPIISRIPISGMTVREAETYLEEMYGHYFVDPFVLIQVTNRKVMVFMNSGTSASIIQMPTENLTLIEAIAQAGGLSEISKSYKIKLIRGDLTDNPEVFYWNISKLSELKNTNIFLEANDIIYVDSKPQYVYRVLREISPYLTLTTTIVTIYGVFFTLNK
ncbi:MAG: polysaccharide biosynthesis/export family protein [Bacteroidales bacterium]|nr:polysaccharide biosynthesis/export family protein [Bacteroidales bacterium]